MFQNQLYCLLFFILLLIENGLVKEDNKKEEEFMIVNEAVVDLRNKPTILPVNYEINNDQLTQLLFNEFVIISTKNNNKYKTNKFLFVEVPDQPNFLNETWTIYSGWIENKKLSKIQSKPNYNLAVKVISANIYKRSCYPVGCIPSDIYITISLGTYLEGIHYQNGWWSVLLPPNSNGLKYGYILESNVHWLPNVKQLPLNELRKKMVETGNTMLGWYYLWGGRSSFLQYLWDSNKQVTGVDCSGLVSLIYKVWGIITPRDAHPMFLKTQNVSNPIFLEPGDLFFFADIPRPKFMHHVMMYIGNNYIVESGFGSTSDDVIPNNGTKIISFKEKYGVNTLQELKWGMLIKPKNLLFWGRLLPNYNNTINK